MPTFTKLRSCTPNTMGQSSLKTKMVSPWLLVAAWSAALFVSSSCILSLLLAMMKKNGKKKRWKPIVIAKEVLTDCNTTWCTCCYKPSYSGFGMALNSACAGYDCAGLPDAGCKIPFFVPSGVREYNFSIRNAAAAMR